MHIDKLPDYTANSIGHTLVHLYVRIIKVVDSVTICKSLNTPGYFVYIRVERRAFFSPPKIHRTRTIRISILVHVRFTLSKVFYC